MEKTNAELTAAVLRADKANREKSLFLSRMSHELRTPMNAILGFAQVLGMDDLDAKQEMAVGQILKAGKILLNLINDVLDISRIETGTVSVNIAEMQARSVVDEALSMVTGLARERGILLEREWVGRECLNVMGDHCRLVQCIINLLSNAIKYNRPGGSVRVASGCDGRTWRLEVQDTGPGIPPEAIPRLFTPFDRLGAEAGPIEGTGLGLALSRSLLRQMGGTLGLSATSDQGSTFYIELKTSAAHAELDVTEEQRVA